MRMRVADRTRILTNPARPIVEAARITAACLERAITDRIGVAGGVVSRRGRGSGDGFVYRYFVRLTALVRGRLGAKLRARVDADDVAMSAYRSFFVRAAAGQFELAETGDLWRLLARMALHKLSHQVERHTAEKRAVSHEERLTDSNGIARDIASLEPSPDEAAAVADELEFIMRSLNETQRRTLELRLQGELLEAIAAELGQSERTIRRTLAHVREIMLKRLPTSVVDASEVDSVCEPVADAMQRDFVSSVPQSQAKVAIIAPRD